MGRRGGREGRAKVRMGEGGVREEVEGVRVVGRRRGGEEEGRRERGGGERGGGREVEVHGGSIHLNTHF